MKHVVSAKAAITVPETRLCVTGTELKQPDITVAYKMRPYFITSTENRSLNNAEMLDGSRIGGRSEHKADLPWVRF